MKMLVSSYSTPFVCSAKILQVRPRMTQSQKMAAKAMKLWLYIAANSISISRRAWKKDAGKLNKISTKRWKGKRTSSILRSCQSDNLTLQIETTGNVNRLFLMVTKRKFLIIARLTMRSTCLDQKILVPF